MAQRIINVGSSANKGDGDPIRTAFIKANDNFTELYGKVAVLENGTIAQVHDTQGSVFGDDSTLLVDAVNNVIPASVISGTLNNDTVGTHTGAVNGTVDGDLTGSVFADDSGVMVDAVNNTMFAQTLTTLGIFGNPTLALNADVIALDAQNGNLTLQTTGTITNNFVNLWEVQGVSASMELTDDGVNSELGLNVDVVDFGTGNTIDMQNCSLLLNGTTFTNEPWISLADLKTEVAASVDFTDFQTRIAAL